MCPTQMRLAEGGIRRKVRLSRRSVSWACSEELYDCHRKDDGVLIKESLFVKIESFSSVLSIVSGLLRADFIRSVLSYIMGDCGAFSYDIKAFDILFSVNNS